MTGDAGGTSNALDLVEGAWYPEDSPPEQWFGEFHRLLSEYGENKRWRTGGGASPGDVPYNASPYHFLQYYAVPPNLPFAVFRDEAVIFGAFGTRKKNKLMLSVPVARDSGAAIEGLRSLLSGPVFSSLLSKMSIGEVLVRDVDERMARKLRSLASTPPFGSDLHLRSLKEIWHSVYEIERTLGMKGKGYSNLRWHLNRFRNAGHRVEALPLPEAVEPAVHLVAEWRRRAIRERKHSYADVRSDKFAARHMGNTNKVMSRVLMVDGRAAAFNLGYPLGLPSYRKLFAHSVGICDLSIPHLSEYAQIDFWRAVRSAGYVHINDGPSWRRGLLDYKRKYRPVRSKRYYRAVVDLLY